MAYALGQLIKRVAMRIMRAVLLLLGCQVSAGEWVGTKGGLSEDGKLAVVVYSQKTAFIDEADNTVLLVEPSSGRKIGPLEEVSSSGGTWGSTATNVHCAWSGDSRILIVNY
jgi:hypothetical protein